MRSSTDKTANAVHFYRALLSLYPQAHRERFGAEMLQTFRDHYADVAARQDSVSLGFWFDVILDEAQSIPHECFVRSEEHTSELQSRPHLVCRLLLEKKKAIAHAAEHQRPGRDRRVVRIAEQV